MTDTAVYGQPGTRAGGDIGERLQEIVTGWKGAERGQPLSDLHRHCLDAAGFAGASLLPVSLLQLRDLDAARLRAALSRLAHRRDVKLQFRVAPVGRFDAALVPVGRAGEQPDRWLLAVEEALPPADAVALYGHALGHLLLNRELIQLGRGPALDPRAGYAHADTLAELRQLEATRSPINRRVLEAYPRLEALLRPQGEPLPSSPQIAGLREQLGRWGWRTQLVTAPYVFTDGRVFVSGSAIRRGPKLRADALLRADASLPIALVAMQRPGDAIAETEQRLTDHAHERLLLPFAYLMYSDGTVGELDWTGSAMRRRTLGAIPGREELLARWLAALGLTDERARDTLLYPYHVGMHRPRSYQEVAINRAVIAVLQARRRIRQPRILLTMATGTGKTPVAFQIVWKLKRTRAIGNVLFLTDRDYLVGQAMDNAFVPFGEARARILGEATTSRDVVFATYQALADEAGIAGLYRDYAHDFFDLVIVDECHRGSAGDESNWRTILEHFDGAIQLGLTATPRSTANVQTYRYFGAPVATYSLRQGINDGFLAPYRVRRVLMGHRDDRTPRSRDGDVPIASDQPPETAPTMVERTEPIARHLAAYLRDTDPMAKTIVFCVDQPHAEAMAGALRRECADMVARYPDYVVRIVADEGTEGKRELGRFSTPAEKTPVVVTTSKLLSTGVDVPACKNIVLARPVGSIVEFKQIIGRGTRLSEPDKTWFTIVDYAGATHHFFDPDFDGDPELVEVDTLNIPSRAAEPLGAAADDTADRGGDRVALGLDTGYDLPASTDGASAPDTPVTRSGGATGTSPPDPHPFTFQPGQETAAPYNPAPPPLAAVPPPALSPAGDGAAAPTAPTPRPGEDPATARPPAPAPLPLPLTADTQLKTARGRRVAVIGETIYELAPDGKTLRPLASYPDYAREALTALLTTPEHLRAHWLQPEARHDVLERLHDAGVDLAELATALGRRDADPLDLLLHVTFGTPIVTRAERAAHLRRHHAGILAAYGPDARDTLEAILDKYARGETSEERDIVDLELLKLPPLAARGTVLELVGPFGGGPPLLATLRTMQQVLYDDGGTGGWCGQGRQAGRLWHA